MEETCDMHSDEDKVVPEKNKKRKLKTPSQVEALEKFYNEHKYPTESMKSQLALEVGLSEKQISGWFCHRRLKDKKFLKDEACATGRQDLSSAIIQDRGSGLRQDSCSSTKQGEYKYLDSREVESRRFHSPEYPAADHGAINGTSSGSSSASQERLFPQSVTPCYMESLKYLSRKSNRVRMEGRGVRNRGYMMESECLNLQNDIENAAIIAVKKNLGRHYLEDGPPLGVEFQSVPPGAFDLPIRDLIQDFSAAPYYMGDHILQKCHSLRVHKQPSLGTQCEGYNSKMNPKKSYPGGSHHVRLMRESDHRDGCTGYPSKGKSSSTIYSNHASGWSSAMDMDGDSAEEASIFNSARNYGIRSKSSIKGTGSSTTGHHNRLYGKKVITTESSYPHLKNYEDSHPLVSPKQPYLQVKPSHLILQSANSIDTEDEETYGKVVKIQDDARRERSISTEYGNQVRLKMPMKNDMKVGQRLRRDEFRPQHKVPKCPSPKELLTLTNQIKGSAGELPTSFSDDETVATSSSME